MDMGHSIGENEIEIEQKQVSPSGRRMSIRARMHRRKEEEEKRAPKEPTIKMSSCVMCCDLLSPADFT
jgi:hypothetical protein